MFFGGLSVAGHNVMLSHSREKRNRPLSRNRCFLPIKEPIHSVTRQVIGRLAHEKKIGQSAAIEKWFMIAQHILSSQWQWIKEIHWKPFSVSACPRLLLHYSAHLWQFEKRKRRRLLLLVCPFPCFSPPLFHFKAPNSFSLFFLNCLSAQCVWTHTQMHP